MADCGRAAELIGPLRDARPGAESAIADRRLRARARHVISENQRVLDMARAFWERDAGRAGELMQASHASLRDDFESSTPAMDELVEALGRLDGVHGARITGGGFGGCAVALAERGAVSVDRVGGAPLLRVVASHGATRTP